MQHDGSCSSPSSETSLQDIEHFLRDAITQLVPEPLGDGPGRPSILPALCLWTGLVVCVIRGFRHQRDLWRLLTHGGLWHYPRFPLSDEAIYDRLERGGTVPLQYLFVQVSAVLATRLAPYAASDLAPFATSVVAVDETTLDRVARRLPALRGRPTEDHLGGTLAGVFDLRLQQWRTLAYRTDWQQNEKVAARSLVADLPPGSLILTDLGYFSFAWFDDLTDAKQWWISRLRAKTSVEPIHTFYHQGTTSDRLVWLGAHRADRAKHAVRLIEFQVGTAHYRYITNVLDPAVLSMVEVARLYARRWDIEMAVNLIKTQVGLHLLWSAKPVLIEQQIIAVLLIAQCLQALRVEIAHRAGVDPFEVSMPLMIRYLPEFARLGHDPIEAFLTNAREVGFIRPSTRTVIRAPQVPDHDSLPAPPDLVLEREPRYAHRNCLSRR